jgi:SRSO17 transposase
MMHWLLARRSRRDLTEFASYRAFGPRNRRIEDLARVAGMRWAIDVCFEDAKEVVGLDQYEVQKWIAGEMGDEDLTVAVL